MTSLPLREIQTIPNLWYESYKRRHPLEEIARSETTQESYTCRNLGAMAHCLAAWFLYKNVSIGERILIIAGNDPIYYAFDIGTLLAGCVNYTLPETIEPNPLTSIIHKEKIRILLLPTYQSYLAYKSALDPLTPELSVICNMRKGEEPVEGDKLICFKNAVAYGKEFWRKNLELLRKRILSIEPHFIAAKFYDSNGTIKQLTHIQFIRHLIHIEEKIGTLEAQGQKTRFLAVLNEATLLSRAAGLYLPLSLHLPITYYSASQMLTGLLKVKPIALALDPTEISALIELMSAHFRKKHSIRYRYFESAIQLSIKVSGIKEEKQKIPFFLSLKHSLGQKYIIRPFRKRYYPKLQYIFTDSVKANENFVKRCNALHLPLVLAQDINEAIKSPTHLTAYELERTRTIGDNNDSTFNEATTPI